jgi:phage tail sheath protein FI
MHGIKVNILTTGARAIQPVSTAIIGMIATATAPVGAAADALNAAFPLNKPVLVTDIADAIGKSGTGGTLKPALEGIADQTTPIIVIIRIAEGADDEETEENIIGTIGVDGIATGMQALLDAEVQLGVRPRILGAPGLDTQAVTVALEVVAKKLRGFVYSAVPVETVAASLVYSAEFSAAEQMLIWPNFSSDFEGDAAARALGLRSRIDQEFGPHYALSNFAVNGVTGINKSVHFDLQDATTPVGLLNDGNITSIVRMNGFRFWGVRTTSDLPQFVFEPVVRMNQFLQDTMANGLAWAIGKPATVALFRDIEETIDAELARLKARDWIIGGKSRIDPALNSPAQLAAGIGTVDYDVTFAAPLENLILNQRITDKYYSGFADQLNN